MKILTMEGIAVLIVSLIASTWMAGVTSAKIESLSDGIIERVQYSAYSGVPFPNCVETVDDKTVILHWVGSCSDEPYFENMKYYADILDTTDKVQPATLPQMGNQKRQWSNLGTDPLSKMY